MFELQRDRNFVSKATVLFVNNNKGGFCFKSKSNSIHGKMSIENFFYLNVLGEIKSANFPLGADGSGIFIRYDIVAGDDWEMVSGVKAGLTQCANSGKYSDEIVFNMPIEFTFKTTNVHGCELR